MGCCFEESSVGDHFTSPARTVTAASFLGPDRRQRAMPAGEGAMSLDALILAGGGESHD